MNDIKMGFLNFSAFLVSFTDVEMWLKLSLLTVTIVYTVMKIIKLSEKE